MKELIEKTLKELIPSEEGDLFEAAQYSLEGGKRLRPLLILTVVETFGCPIENALYPACALEMVHAYSLIHDDLPCMDDDAFRRGKPSLHKKYSEWHAVLTGDFLLTYAFEVVAKAPNLSNEEKNALSNTLARRAGGRGMIAGQMLDLGGKIIHPDQIKELHQKKTGALITAALEFGGIIAKQTDLSLLLSIGKHLGLAYQLIDDILDEDGAVKFFGIKQTEEFAQTLFEKALRAIQTLPNRAPKLEDLAKEMIFRCV